MQPDELFPFRERRPCGEALDLRDRVCVVVEEYRALNQLLALRLSAIDQRLLLVGGAVAAALGGFAALPADTQTIVLLSTPASLAWLLQMTIAHTRSKEDVVRRIDEIECQVNQLAGEELFAFQSRHPNRRQVGGRSGRTAVAAVASACLTGILCCLYLFRASHLNRWPWQPAYGAYAGFMLLHTCVAVWRLWHYRYRKAPVPRCPLFLGRRADAIVAGPPPQSGRAR